MVLVEEALEARTKTTTTVASEEEEAVVVAAAAVESVDPLATIAVKKGTGRTIVPNLENVRGRFEFSRDSFRFIKFLYV